jgi:hypothetical protein
MSTGEQNKNGLKTETDGFGVAVNQWQCGMLESKDKTEIWLPTVSKSPMKFILLPSSRRISLMHSILKEPVNKQTK